MTKKQKSFYEYLQKLKAKKYVIIFLDKLTLI